MELAPRTGRVTRTSQKSAETGLAGQRQGGGGRTEFITPPKINYGRRPSNIPPPLVLEEPEFNPEFRLISDVEESGVGRMGTPTRNQWMNSKQIKEIAIQGARGLKNIPLYARNAIEKGIAKIPANQLNWTPKGLSFKGMPLWGAGAANALSGIGAIYNAAETAADVDYYAQQAGGWPKVIEALKSQKGRDKIFKFGFKGTPMEQVPASMRWQKKAYDWYHSYDKYENTGATDGGYVIKPSKRMPMRPIRPVNRKPLYPIKPVNRVPLQSIRRISPRGTWNMGSKRRRFGRKSYAWTKGIKKRRRRLNKRFYY